MLDPFAGCATACVAAERLQRQWVGIDLPPLAAKLVNSRLQKDMGLFLIFTTAKTSLAARNGSLPSYKTHRHTLYGRQEGVCGGCQVIFPFRNMTVARRAGSTGRRNTFSLTGLQALVQSFGGSSPSEGLAGPCIERVSNNCEYVRTVCAQIGSFREVLSKQSIGVLVRSALPRAVRFAEVDGKAGCDPQIRMPGHLCSLVPGQRAAKLRWQCRDRPGDGIANRFSPMLAPAGKQYDVCLFPERAEEQSPHVPRKTGNVLTAAWPIAINVLVACRPTSGTTSSLPEGIHRHLGPRPRSNAPSQSLPRTEQAPHAVPSPVDLANATCSVQTDPTAVCVPS